MVVGCDLLSSVDLTGRSFMLSTPYLQDLGSFEPIARCWYFSSARTLSYSLPRNLVVHPVAFENVRQATALNFPATPLDQDATFFDFILVLLQLCLTCQAARSSVASWMWCAMVEIRISTPCSRENNVVWGVVERHDSLTVSEGVDGTDRP